MSNNEQIGYSSIIFYCFAVSFFVLGIINIILPISDFKITVLSVVAFLLSLQQLVEAKEEVEEKLADLEKKTLQRDKILEVPDLPAASVMDDSNSQNTNCKWISTFFPISRRLFAAALVIMVIGLTLDIEFQYSAIANTASIVSFAAIFFTMGYKELFMARINKIYDDIYSGDQRIISYQQEKISKLLK